VFVINAAEAIAPGSRSGLGVSAAATSDDEVGLLLAHNAPAELMLVAAPETIERLLDCGPVFN
jgi:hypothetical protein